MKIELCAASIKAIDLAAKYQLDRIELCQNIEIAGTTPSHALTKYALDKGIETHVLIRPRIGGFAYSEEEFNLILSDVNHFKELGVHGVVVGCLDDENNLHPGRLSSIKDVAGDMDLTFHRGFDDLSNWRESIDILVQIGFKRILTAGLAQTVDVGMQNLLHIKDLTRGRIELMVGGGVNIKNIHSIIKSINPEAIHFSATSLFTDEMESKFGGHRLEIDEQKLAELVSNVTV